MKIFVFILLAIQSLQAADLDFNLTKTFDDQKKVYQFAAQPPEGHYFNTKAPNKVVSGKNKIKLTSETEQLIAFQHVTDKATLTFYICDDQKTFCKPVVKKTESEKATGIRAVEAFMAKEKYQGMKLHGFMLNDIDKAFKTAKQKNKPLLIDFFGIWCPPCNQMDSAVFSSKEFKKQSKSFVLVKVDADDSTSWDLKSKYQIEGYPTFLFLNSKGEELYRVVGSTSKARFIEAMSRVEKLKNKSLQQLETLADQKDIEVISALAGTALEQKNYDQAELYFSKVPESFEDDLSYIKLKKMKMDELLKSVGMIKEQIKTSNDSRYNLERYKIIFDVLEKQKKKQELKSAREEYIKYLNGILNDSKLAADLGLQSSDIYSLIAENYEATEDQVSAKANFKLAAEQAEQLKHGKVDRGFYLDKAYYLYKAGELIQAHETYKKLQNTYPTDFSFYFYEADLYMKEKKWLQAEELSRVALGFSYGDNKLRVTKQLSQILSELGKKQEAVALLENAIKNQPLPEDKKNRTHQYFKALTDLKERLLK
jgi:thiol-disulfide isomerase/thioredoxin